MTESGALYGCGLDEFGVSPERLLLVNVGQRHDLGASVDEERARPHQQCPTSHLGHGSERHVDFGCRAGAVDIDRLARRGSDRFDVAILLGRNIADEIIECAILGLASKVKRLERLVHQGGHFAKLATHEFLNGGSSGRVWTFRNGKVNSKQIVALNHSQEHRAHRLPT